MRFDSYLKEDEMINENIILDTIKKIAGKPANTVMKMFKDGFKKFIGIFQAQDDMTQEKKGADRCHGEFSPDRGQDSRPFPPAGRHDHSAGGRGSANPDGTCRFHRDQGRSKPPAGLPAASPF